MRGLLALLLVLAACGGAVAPVVLVVQQAEQAASAPAASAPDVVQAPASTAAAAPSWRELASEDWTRPVFGGYVRAGDYSGCVGQADQDVAMPPPVVPAGATWVTIGPMSGASWAAGTLTVDSMQTPGAGWAIAHAQALPFDRAIRVSAVIDLQQDAGAWTGLTLWDGEADYREVALYWRADGLRVGWWAPCYWRDITAVRPGARDLQITYTPPPSAVCWQAHVDGALVHSEACTHAGAPLVGNAHAGLWVVNLDAEARRLSTGRVRASVGPVVAEQQEGP